MCSRWEANKSPWLESVLQSSRITETLNNNSQDRLMQPWVIHSPHRIRASITCCSLAMWNFYFLTHAMRTDSALHSQKLTNRGAFEKPSYIPTGVSLFLDNKCRHRTESLHCTHSSFSLLTSPQLDCLRTWPSVSRCLLNSEGPPKGPKFLCCSPNHFPQRLTDVLKEPFNREDKWRQMKTWPPEAHPRPR